MERKNTKVGKLFESMGRYMALVVLIIVMIVLFSALSPAFFKYSNLMNIIRQTSITLIVAIGMTFVILSGGIDLSVGSNIAVSGMLGVVILTITGNPFLALVLTLALATIFGLFNGFLIAKFGLTAFIVTLAMQFFGRGATMLLNGASSIKVNNPVYTFIGQGDIAGIPVCLIFIIVLYVIFIFVNDRTVFGRKIYAIGGNREAARASGINVKKTTISIYTLAGLIAGIGAILTVGRLGSAQPYAGQGLEFECITAVVLGGTSLEGGKGNLKGTILGALLVGIISNGLGLLSLDNYVTYLCTGALILFAVISDMAITYYTNKRLIPKADPNAVDMNKSEDTIGVAEVQKMESRVVEMKNITKTFPGMKALDDVNFKICPGEIHALMGENGAGKSTLMKILCGEETLTSGGIFVNGSRVDIKDPIQAKEMGISLIHQEIALIPELSVAENIFFGKEHRAAMPLFVNKKQMIRDAKKIMDRFGLDIDVKKKASSLTVSEQQMVEIAKSLESNAWLIVMDEPTSSLTDREIEKLFELTLKLKKENYSIVYISHRMQEIFSLCDKITILRDGKLVGERMIKEATEDEIISMMVGRSLTNVFDRDSLDAGAPVLEIKNLSKRGVFADISFTVHEHEVIGLSGLVGAGRTEVAQCICGLAKADGGEIWYKGQKVDIKSTTDALKRGIAYVPEDRKREGFVPFMSICENATMSSYGNVSHAGIIDSRKQKEFAQDYVKALDVKATSIKKNVVELSGGNQQKVSLANRLATKPSVLILDEPTRGIDIGAKAEIHRIIADLAKDNVAIILISSEMPELIGCSDRVVVLREGVMTAVLDRDQMDQNTIMSYAAQH